MLQYPLVRASEIAKDPKEKQEQIAHSNNKNEKKIQLKALKEPYFISRSLPRPSSSSIFIIFF